MNYICYGEMHMFDRAILIQSISTCWLEFIPIFYEKLPYGWVVVELTPLIHVAVLVRDASWSMMFKKVMQPTQRSSFRDPSITMKALTEMVSD